MRRSVLRLAVACTLIAAAVVGTGGYTITADRPISVAVVEDDRAAVGVIACRNGSTVRVSVTNRIDRPVTVRLVAGDVARTTTVAAGDHRRVRLTTEAEVVAARLAGDGRIVELTRPVTSACDP